MKYFYLGNRTENKRFNYSYILEIIIIILFLNVVFEDHILHFLQTNVYVSMYF